MNAGPHGSGLIAVLRAACLGQPGLPMTALDESAVRWAVETGLGPLLARAVAHDPQAATSPLWPLVQGANLTARYLAAEHIDAMTQILDAFRGAAPPPVLLKGISLCDQHYPEPHLRPMRDIDFLLEAGAIPSAESILLGLGYRQSSGRPAAFYDGHHHSSPFVHPDTGVWVDVHRALVAAGGALGADRIFGAENLETQLRWSEFRGRRVRRLSDELQIVHLACHWACGLRAVGGMVAMADMACLLKNSPAVDWPRILEWTDGSAAARHLGLLLTYLQKHRIIQLPPEILRRIYRMQTAFARLTFGIGHSLLDRYVVDGRDFGTLMTEQNFNRVWRRLILRRRRPRGCGGRRGKEANAPGQRARRDEARVAPSGPGSSW
ncbi:MAG TPA: nucleotidyltransferase family protein [Methylomirabilota bacterium]